MTKKKKQPMESTASPARNFTIPLAERVRALGGPPAYIVRKRRIEDLQEKHVLRLLEALDVSEEHAEAVLLTIDLAPLNKLIETHNKYYPIEANLPMSLRGSMMERGQPWRPLPLVTRESLLALARVRWNAADEEPS